jgi:predicted TIM-barrel fold metal-dependent hydrolase
VSEVIEQGEHAPETLSPCLHSMGSDAGYLGTPMPSVGDAEGERLASDLPPVVDAHVHLFPDKLFDAIWRWFDQYGWPVRYRLKAREVIDFQLSRGVSHVVLMQYAHRPGIAREMNRWLADLCRDEPRVTALATVYPGEEGAREILEDAFASGLAGVKIHCHVQAMGPDEPALDEVYRLCADRGKPVVMHAGREPKSPGYRCDPHLICSADRVARVLEDHPRLRLSIPHLGADEFDAYRRLLERHDNLWLDTTMMLSDYFPLPPPPSLLEVRPERILYGTDFPNIPYAWDREVKRIAGGRIRAEALEGVLGGNAKVLFGLGKTPKEST